MQTRQESCSEHAMNGNVDPIAAERLALDRARLDGELELKRRELELREREINAGDKARSRWSSPLIVAAATAILGLFVNLMLSQYTARQQLALEREKRQGELLIRAIGTDDTEAARRNLEFLIDIGLLPDEDGQITTALEDPERVPVLPSGPARPVRELPPEDPRRTWVASIGRLEGRGMCTAFLVAPDLIITASYCVATDDGTVPSNPFTLMLNYLEGAGDGARRYEVVSEPVELVSGMPSLALGGGTDYALLRVPIDASRSGWLPLSSTPPQVGEALSVVGHIGGGPAQITDDSSCRITDMGSDRFQHRCVSGGGLAGGPIFNLAGEVVGLEFAMSPGGNNVAIRADRIVSLSTALNRIKSPSAAADATHR
jgi:V8-like Glu-specific endopeptidase